MNRWTALALFLFFVGALAFRLPQLDTRPFHNDEAVNAVKVVELWQGGHYLYDPDEYHGPTLHYATLPFLSFGGAENPNELKNRTLRLAPIYFGAAIILLLVLFIGGLSLHALVWSAFFIAISPAMVFYSRYFIHEMLLIFFTTLTIGAGWRYMQRPSAKWAITAGTGFGLMFATKETFVLTATAMFIAFIATAWSSVGRDKTVWRGCCRAFVGKCKASVNPRHLLLAFLATLLIWLIFFSSFFTNYRGLLDSVLTYFPWLKRAAGHSPHIHPWYFYLERLAWFHPVKGPAFSEALILILAIIGMFVAFTRGSSPLLRFLAIYTVVLTTIYSVISYKTPWCLLNFYLGMILLAGVGAATLVQLARKRSLQVVVVLILFAATAQLALQSWRASYRYASDRRNPYVYAQTVPDLLKLVERAEGIASISPTGFDTIVKVISPDSDYWPLPWYLRRFENIGWYEKIPDDPFAPLIIVASDFEARLDDKSDRKWIMVGIHEFRPTKFFELYVELELWRKYVESLPPEPE